MGVSGSKNNPKWTTPNKHYRKIIDAKSIESIVLTVGLKNILISIKQEVGITKGGGLEYGLLFSRKNGKVACFKITSPYSILI